MRDQTHSYWYIPSAPRMNYSLLVMESAGMMKMATGEGSPLRQGAGTGSRLTFGGYGGFWRWNSRSMLRPGSFRVRRIYGCKGYVGGASGAPRGRGARPPPSWPAPVSSDVESKSIWWLSFPKITSPVDFVPFRLRQIFLFFKTLK